MTLTTLYLPGSGITSLGGKLPDAIMRRIEWLGRMSDSVNVCVANNDWDGLLTLASQYSERGMLRTANHVMLLAKQSEVK